MLRLLLILPATLLCVAMNAASDFAKLNGRVLDDQQKPLEFVVVTLLSAADSSLVKGAISGSDGTFAFEAITPGNYFVSTTFTGYTGNMLGPFTLVAAQELTIPDVVLAPSQNMDVVTVTAARPLFIRKPDKLIMDVENSPVRISGTAFDVISKAPGVFVDQNNNITLRGKSGVQVYIDNKPTYLAGDQLKIMLESISASDIVNVEIITNPSAKYNAEGSAGIINVITKKGSRQGFNGTVRAGAGYGRTPKYDAGFNFNYAKEKFNIYGKVDHGRWESRQTTTIDRNVPFNDTTTNFNQRSLENRLPQSGSFKLGIDLFAKKGITWGAKVEGGLTDEKGTTQNETVITTSGNPARRVLNQHNNRFDLNNRAAANIYFSQVFDTAGRELSASVDYLRYDNFGREDFDIRFEDGAGNLLTDPQNQRNVTNTGINIYVGQVDYSHPFGKNYKLEAGAKSSYVETANGLLFEVMDNSNGAWGKDTTRSNEFIYTEQINAVYATGYADWGNWQVQGGVRMEQTTSDGNSPTTGERRKRSYVQFFPSVFILQKLNENNSINYTYSRRINRPNYENLNPFVYYLDQFTFQLGNPFLQPELSHNVEITYSYREAAFLTVGAIHTRNSMTDVTRQIDSTGTTFQTTENLRTADNAYAGFSIPIPLGKMIFFQTEFNAAYNRFYTDLYGTSIDNRSWVYSASANFSISLPKTWKIQGWGWYRSSMLYGIFNLGSMAGVGCGISKSFMNEQLQLSATVTDIFHTNGTRVKINFQNQDVRLVNDPESRRVYLRARYSFGNKKAARKENSKSGAEELINRTGQ
jgi:outer membrane receptor protein involved in Fe transport